jgi:hypothetical protein
MTILYNTTKQEVLGYYDPYYKVLGKPGTVEPPIVELVVVNTPPPEQVSSGMQVLSSYIVDLENKEYRQIWNEHPLPAPENPPFDLEHITRLLIRKVDGEVLSPEEDAMLTQYKTLL